MSTINSLNNYLTSQDKKQRTMLYVALAVGIFVLAYLFFLSDMLESYEINQNTITQKEMTLDKLKKASAFATMKGLKTNIEKQKELIAKKQTNIRNKKEKIFATDGAQLDDGEFATFLEDIIMQSKRFSVVLKDTSIKSQELPYIGLLEIKRILHVEGHGQFLNILKWVRYVESQRLLSKLKSFTIKRDENKTLSFSVEFNVAGLL